MGGRGGWRISHDKRPHGFTAESFGCRPVEQRVSGFGIFLDQRFPMM